MGSVRQAGEARSAARLNHPGIVTVYSVAFSPDDKTLATGSLNAARLRNVASRKITATSTMKTGNGRWATL